ncbi:MAG TPA: DUF2934 domain-containing protein [Dissulfurispiraceae bacterium]|nr:DUF2934 domain-containing protein [Dissulfurispiraceae bacterium]
MSRHEEIATLAYQLYEIRGCLLGRDLEDWLEAERILNAKHLTLDAMMTEKGHIASVPVRATPSKSSGTRSPQPKKPVATSRKKRKTVDA